MQHFRFFTDHTLSVWISLYINAAGRTEKVRPAAIYCKAPPLFIAKPRRCLLQIFLLHYFI